MAACVWKPPIGMVRSTKATSRVALNSFVGPGGFGRLSVFSATGWTEELVELTWGMGMG
jgi:hypothetical protein